MNSIPLTPTQGGGLCIPDLALQPADIIVSAAPGVLDSGIRYVTQSQVNHAALYAGHDQVIEALLNGVMVHTLSASLKGDYLAVAYRVRGITLKTAAEVVKLASRWSGKQYDTLGALGAGARNPLVCVFVYGIGLCSVALGGGFRSSDKFYCSQLVLEAYREAGASFITQNPNTSQPQDMVTAYSHGKLLYVGHLIAGSGASRRMST
jgi:cell wall-associated NlpC family hydrolase